VTTTAVYDPPNFVADLRRELARRKYPRWPERPFWQALGAACDSDLARELSARNAARDSEYFSRQKTFPLVDEDPDFLFLDGRHSPQKRGKGGVRQDLYIPARRRGQKSGLEKARRWSCVSVILTMILLAPFERKKLKFSQFSNPYREMEMRNFWNFLKIFS
jgi:hypothetical protein